VVNQNGSKKKKSEICRKRKKGKEKMEQRKRIEHIIKNKRNNEIRLVWFGLDEILSGFINIIL